MILGALLRLWALGGQSLWWDEAWQWWVASAPTVTASLERLFDPGVGAHPPLSHLVTRVALVFGATEFWLRLPAVLFGVATIPLLYAFVRRLATPRRALIAAAALALAPFHVYYSQEARMYAQLMFLAVAASWALLVAVERGRKRDWVLYVALAIAAAYTHVYASLGLLAHGLWVVSARRDRLLAFALSGVATLLAFAPLVPYFASRVSIARVPYGGAGATWAGLPYALFVFGAGFSLGPSVATLREERGLDVLQGHAPALVLVFAVVGTLALVGAFACRRLGRNGALVLLGALVPLLGVFAASFLPRMTFNVRYAAWAFPFVCVLVSEGLYALTRRRRALGVAMGGLLAGLWAVSLGNHFGDATYAKEDVRAAMATWHEQSTGEALLSYNGFPTVDYYMTTEERASHFPIWRRANTVVRIHAVMAETGGARGVWVLLARDWHRIVENAVRANFIVLEDHAYDGRVRLLKIAPGE